MTQRWILSTFVLAGAMTSCGLTGVGDWWGGTLHRDQVFEHGGVEHTYHFYEPQGASGSLPLVVLLHGGGGTIDNHVGVGSVDWPHQVWLDIADEDGLYLVVPQGLDEQWNCCRSDCDHCGEQDDVGFLTALIDQLAASWPIDTARVYATGESNGGLMSMRLAQEAGERFAAVGIVIAQMPANNECGDPSALAMPIMFQLGTDDPIIPYEGGLSPVEKTGTFQSADESVAHWRAHNACDEASTTSDYPDLDTRDRSTAHREDWSCPATDSAVSLIVMDGAGHVAPSIEVRVGTLWEIAAGQQNHDLEGARELWDFMGAFSRE